MYDSEVLALCILDSFAGPDDQEPQTLRQVSARATEVQHRRKWELLTSIHGKQPDPVGRPRTEPGRDAYVQIPALKSDGGDIL